MTLERTRLGIKRFAARPFRPARLPTAPTPASLRDHRIDTAELSAAFHAVCRALPRHALYHEVASRLMHEFQADTGQRFETGYFTWVVRDGSLEAILDRPAHAQENPPPPTPCRLGQTTTARDDRAQGE